MALAVDSEMASQVGFGIGGNPSSPQTFSFTNTAGTLLVVMVGLGCGSSETSSFGTISYNSVSMTQLVQRTPGGGATGGRVGIYYLLNPATGSNTVSLGFSNNNFNAECWAGAISFTGNNASSPFAQNTSNGASSGTSATGTLSGCVSGNITICVAGGGANFTTSDQTLSWAKNVDNNTSLGNGRGSRAASSGSVTHSFTLSASDSWATAIAEVAAGGGPSQRFMWLP